MAKSLPINENPLREASIQARDSLSLLIERVQKPVAPPQPRVVAGGAQPHPKKK